jgi:hypothetical protein
MASNDDALITALLSVNFVVAGQTFNQEGSDPQTAPPCSRIRNNSRRILIRDCVIASLH